MTDQLLAHGIMVCHGQYNTTCLWEESFRWLCNAAGPLDVPLNGKFKENWIIALRVEGNGLIKHFFHKGPAATVIMDLPWYGSQQEKFIFIILKDSTKIEILSLTLKWICKK